MAEEQLTLVDGMSPSLRRIYQEAERLNKRMLTLRSNIKALEKPTSMSYLKRELKNVETQAKQTERALKSMKAAEINNAKYGAFKVGANGRYYLNGMQVRNADRLAMAEAYNRNIQNAQLRRNRLLWEAGRTTSIFDPKTGVRLNAPRNIGSFDERFAARKFGLPLNSKLPTAMSNLSNIFNKLNSQSSNLSMGFIKTITSLYLLADVITRIRDIANNLFIKPQDQYVSNITRVAMTSDKSKTPKEMMDQLYETAFRTRAPVDATVSLYNRIALSGVKADNERIRRFVESFNKVTAISGTGTQENRAVMLQLAQGIGSNRLGGDEFRSISEQAPLFKYFLAKGLGVNPGALKQMGAEGKLTAEAILKAMENVQDQIDNMFTNAPLTLQQALTRMMTQWEFLVTKQFDGYLAVRDLIVDIVDWMRSAEGEETISKVVRYWNIFIIKCVEGLRQLAPIVKLILNHLPEILRFIRFLIGSLLIIIGLKKQLDFIVWARNTAIGFGMATTAANAFGGALLGVAEKVNLILAGLIAYVWVLKKAWEIGQKIADKVQEKNEYDAMVEPDKGVVDKYMQHWESQNMWDMSNPAGRLKHDKAYAIERTRIENKLRKSNIERYNKLQEQRKVRQAQEVANELGIPVDLIAIANSAKNIPMDVKGGKLDSIDRINDDVTLNTDNLQMLKAIAERSWIMQNEVTVPQKVEVNIDKSVNVEPDTIADVINKGVEIATASSMRGAAAL